MIKEAQQSSMLFKETVSQLLDAVWRQSQNGFTLLHHIATTSVEDSERVKMATLLLDHGASLEQRDRLLSSTPLGWACRWGHRALADLYLSRGAVPSEPGTEAWAQPLAWATREGHAEIVARLIEFSAA